MSEPSRRSLRIGHMEAAGPHKQPVELQNVSSMTINAPCVHRLPTKYPEIPFTASLKPRCLSQHGSILSIHTAALRICVPGRGAEGAIAKLYISNYLPISAACSCSCKAIRVLRSSSSPLRRPSDLTRLKAADRALRKRLSSQHVQLRGETKRTSWRLLAAVRFLFAPARVMDA